MSFPDLPEGYDRHKDALAIVDPGASNPAGVALAIHQACTQVIHEGGSQREDPAVRLMTNCGRDAGYPAPPAQILACPLRHEAPPLGCAHDSADGKSLVWPRVSDFQLGPVGRGESRDEAPLGTGPLRPVAQHRLPQPLQADDEAL